MRTRQRLLMSVLAALLVTGLVAGTCTSPQLYFSHEFKTGNPYQLAQEVRNGLNRTNSQ
jgi:hypothetical protein